MAIFFKAEEGFGVILNPIDEYNAVCVINFMLEDALQGDIVEGKITRITPFGAFVQLSPSVEALVHVSEMSDDETVDPQQIFQLNEKKQFKVLDIDVENRKIALSLKSAK